MPLSWQKACALGFRGQLGVRFSEGGLDSRHFDHGPRAFEFFDGLTSMIFVDA